LPGSLRKNSWHSRFPLIKTYYSYFDELTLPLYIGRCVVCARNNTAILYLFVSLLSWKEGMIAFTKCKTVRPPSVSLERASIFLRF